MAGRVRYSESLSVPVGWWLSAGALVAVLGAIVYIGMPLSAKVLVYAVFGGAVVAVFLGWGSTRVEVDDTQLRAGGAHIPLAVLGAPQALDRPGMRLAMGREGDPSAFLLTRPWLHTGVIVPVLDPDDDTPYWLVGSRYPQRLAEAIAAAREPAGPAGGS